LIELYFHVNINLGVRNAAACISILFRSLSLLRSLGISISLASHVLEKMHTKMIAQHEEEQYRYYHSILWEGIKTGVFGLVFGITLATGLRRFYSPFRQLPFYVKSTTCICPGILTISIGANRESHAFHSYLHPELRSYEDEAEAEQEVKRIYAEESAG